MTMWCGASIARRWALRRSIIMVTLGAWLDPKQRDAWCERCSLLEKGINSRCGGYSQLDAGLTVPECFVGKGAGGWAAIMIACLVRQCASASRFPRPKRAFPLLPLYLQLHGTVDL